MLEDGDLGGAELVGKFLHGGGIAVQVTVIPDGDNNIKLPWGEIHGPSLQMGVRGLFFGH